MENENEWGKKTIWIIRGKSKDNNNVLVMPSGQIAFDTEYTAQKALGKYRHKNEYMVLSTSKFVKNSDTSKSKIDDFLLDTPHELKKIEPAQPNFRLK